jgi:RND superfamily putative drug exporter
MIKKIARFSYKHRPLVIFLWACLLIGVVFWAHYAGNGFSDDVRLNNTDSQAAIDLLNQRFPAQAGSTGDIVFKASTGVNDPLIHQEMVTLLNKVQAVGQVTGIQSPYSNLNLDQISSNGDIAYAVIHFNAIVTGVQTANLNEIQSLVSQANTGGLQIETGGGAFSTFQPHLTSEAISFVAAIIILILAFGSVIAMGLPIFNALIGIGIGISAVELLAHLITLPSFSTELGAMLGIGVGVDYALLIVTRYRQALEKSLGTEAAVLEAMNTAGRSVFFAGTAVVVSLLGMLLSGVSFIEGLGLASAIVVAVTMLSSLTLLPTVLGYLGHRIDYLQVPRIFRAKSSKNDNWFRWSRFLQKRPWRFLVLGVITLSVLAVPFFSINLGSSDSSSQPTSDTTRRAYDLTSEGFGVGANGPLLIAAAVNNPNDINTMQSLQNTLRGTSGVAFVTPLEVNRAGNAVVMNVIPTTSPEDTKTTALIKYIRGTLIPNVTAGTSTSIHVGGITATFADLAALLKTRLPVFISVVLGFSFVLILLVFRSVVIPIKAVVMNVFSIGAAYGVLVAIFQWGWLKTIVGLGQGGPIDSYVPMIMFAILFGLSMDYEVFLLSRIKEEYGATGNSSLAVANGLARTARVISAAALIMVVVFGSLVISDYRILKEFGLGLAAAILVDATIVRLVMVPAIMEILGKANWWFPKWLNWLPHLPIGDSGASEK